MSKVGCATCIGDALLSAPTLSFFMVPCGDINLVSVILFCIFIVSLVPFSHMSRGGYEIDL